MLPVKLAYDMRRNDPNDGQIQKFLDRGEWEPALRYLDRIMRKNSAIRLQVNWALIAIVSGNFDRTTQGIANLSKLINNTAQPIIDVSILEAIDKTVPEFVCISNPLLIPNMWKFAAAASPKDLQLQELWYHSCFGRKDWIQASMISLRACKISEKKHMHHWRAITSRYLDAQYGDPKFRELSSQIMMKLLQQSFSVGHPDESGSKKGSVSKPGKKQIVSASIAVQTVEDLRLAVEIYQRQNRWIEAAALLDDGCNTGLRSSIARGNWQLVIEKIEILVSLAKYDELWRLCYQLLCDAVGMGSKQPNSSPYSYGKTGDDMAVWKGAVLSCYEKGDTILIEKMKDLLNNPKLIKRHRLLSAIDLSIKLDPSNATIPSPVSFATAVGNYLEEFGGSEVAYGDLRTFAAKLNKEKIQELIDQSDDYRRIRSQDSEQVESSCRRYVMSQINNLKFRYTFIFSNPDQGIDTETRGAFAADCLDLYRLSLRLEKTHASTERGWGDEAAILAACTLLHLYRDGVEGAQLQATLILEKLLEHSKHHYGAMLLLIRLYVRQGVWPRAYKYYQRLDLKNIQYFTEAWMLLNRAGSIFPYRNKLPNEELYSALNHHASYAQSKQTITHRLSQLYDEEQNYIGLCEVHEFLALCHESVSKAANLAELSRLAYRTVEKFLTRNDTPLGRVWNLQPDHHYKGKYHELRATRALPNYERVTTEPIEQIVGLGPHTNQLWIECEDMMHQWRNFIQTGHWRTVTAETHHAIAQEMHESSKKFYQYILAEKTPTGLTKAEMFVAWLLRAMSAVQESCSAAEVAGEKDSLNTTEKADEWVRTHLKYYDYNWQYCAGVIQYFNVVTTQAAEAFCDEAVTTFDQSQWETLHDYYKMSEIWMIYPWFVKKLIEKAKLLNHYARKTSLPLDECNCLNVPELGGHIHDYLDKMTSTLAKYSEGACRILEHWEERESLTLLTAGARGQNSQPSRLQVSMSELLEEDWAREKCTDIINGWCDAVAGFEIEHYQWWTVAHWDGLEQYM